MSKNKKELFCGAATAIVTPFSGGKIDYRALGNLIDFQTDGGIETIVVAGTTGEAPTISYEELEDIFAFSAERAKGKAKILAGCGCNCTERAVEIAKIAEWSGCNGLLAVNPYYNKPSASGLIKHYLAITESTNLPIILYNVPSRTGVNITLPVYRELAKHERIVAVKEASGNLSAIAQLIDECGDALDVYSGNDDQIVPIMSLGGKGVISVVSGILPKETHDICAACLAGDFKTGAELQLKYLKLINTLFCEVNPVPVKAASALLGLCNGELRLPLCEMEDDNHQKLVGVMKQYGLL